MMCLCHIRFTVKISFQPRKSLMSVSWCLLHAGNVGFSGLWYVWFKIGGMCQHWCTLNQNDLVFPLPLVLAGSAPEDLGQCGNSVEVTGVTWGWVRQRGEGLSEERHLQERWRHLITSYIQHRRFSSWAFKQKTYDMIRKKASKNKMHR